MQKRLLAVVTAAALALSGCTGGVVVPEGSSIQDGYGNRVEECLPGALPTAPVPTPTTLTVECEVLPPLPPSISPSPVSVPSPSPVEVPVETPLPDMEIGYYAAGNANMTADIATIESKGGAVELVTQYRSVGSQSIYYPMVVPGYTPLYGYLTALINDNDVTGNFVIENTCFQASDCTARTFTIEGITYSVPAANAKRNWANDADGSCGGRAVQDYFGYGQITSGALDGLLHSLLAQTRDITGNLILHWFSEVDTDAECGMPEGGVNYTRSQANARAAAAAVYMTNFMKDPPGNIAPVGNNVKFTVGMGGFHAASYNEVYTQAVRDVVDYYNFNTYWRDNASDWVQELTNDLNNVRKPGWAVKDVLVTEFGTPATATFNGPWSGVKQTQAMRLRMFPRAVWDVNNVCDNCSKIRKAAYFNSNGTWATLSPAEEGKLGLGDCAADTMFSRWGE